MLRSISHELKHHAPFTAVGALTGIAIAAAFVYLDMPHWASHRLFEVCHPLHVLLSAMATAAMFRLHGRRGLLATVVVGYVGAIGIGTISDCLMPYLGEWLLGFEDAEAHIGFIEHWYLVNPAALVGVALACWRPNTQVPHAGHVLLSTWASLFHMLMAIGRDQLVGPLTIAAVAAVLFLAVWLPCCTSDIVFPLMLPGKKGENH